MAGLTGEEWTRGTRAAAHSVSRLYGTGSGNHFAITTLVWPVGSVQHSVVVVAVCHR